MSVVTPAIGSLFNVAEADAIEWLDRLPDESVDLIVTDPAYESLEKHRKVGTTTRLKQSDASSNEWFPIFPNFRFEKLFARLYRVLKPNRHCYMLCDSETMFIVKPMAEAVGFKFWRPLVWDKQKIGMGYHYRSRCEFVLFFEKGKRKLNDLSVPDVLCVPSIRGGGCQCPEETTRDTSRSTTTDDCGWSITSYGSEPMGQFHRVCRSTISTKSKTTIDSKISKCSRRSTINEPTRPTTSEEVANGIDDARRARNLSQLPPSTTTSAPKDGSSLDGVDHVRSPRPSGKSVCERCGKGRRSFPTEKPVELLETLIRQSAQPGELVIDPFTGSGSTGVAAIKSACSFMGCDVQASAVELARGRIAEVGGDAGSDLAKGQERLW